MKRSIIGVTPWLILLGVIVGCPSGEAAAAAEPSRLPPLVPRPREVQVRAGTAQVDTAWWIRLVDTPADAVGARELLDDARTATGRLWRVGSGAAAGRSIVVRPGPAPPVDQAWQRDDAYELTVWPDSIVLAAPSLRGRFYAVQTLRQLLRGAASGRIPCLHIADYPTLRWRGVSDDISRGQASTLADFRRTLEHLAFYKVNLYCLYLEDMARFWSAPEVGVERGALTPGELKRITEEAKRLHVTVMPIFQTLGHQERLLALPRFEPLAERRPPGPAASALGRFLWRCLPALAGTFGLTDPDAERPAATCFSPALPEARGRVAGLVDEIAASVESPFFHLGGDEPADLGNGTSRETILKQGLGAVYADYMNALISHVEKADRRQAVVFSDVLLSDPEARRRLMKSAAVVDWHYEPDASGTSIRRLQQAGFRTVFASPGLWNWFGIYPDYGRAFPNIAQLAAAAARYDAAGLIVASWGDGGAESLRRSNWPGYAYAADAAWRGPDTTSGFLGRFATCEYGTAARELVRAERLVGWQSFSAAGLSQRVAHREPRLRTHTPAWIARMKSLARDMNEARAALFLCGRRVRFDRERVEVLDYVAARFQYVAQRELTLDRLARTLDERPWSTLTAAERAAAVRQLGALRDSSSALSGRFAALWRRDNRTPMLSPLLSRQAGQTAALDRLLHAATEGTLRSETAGRGSSTPGGRATAARSGGPFGT